MPGYAVQDPIYQPAMRLITGITAADPAEVTTSFPHDYLPGLIVRLYVPPLYGMFQADGLTGTIMTVGSSTTFTININTTSFDPFVIPSPEPWYSYEYPMVVPVGEINSSLDQATRNVL